MRGDLFRFGDDLLRARGRDDDNTAAVGDHEIAGMDLDAATLNLLLDAVLHDAAARGHGNDGARREWEEGDSFTVPLWRWHAHASEGREPALLFVMNDRPILDAFGWYREAERS